MQTKQQKNPAPVILGTGLIALDLVSNCKNDLPYVWAGGSCGNVLLILSWLGWDAYPIARLGNDQAAGIIKKEFGRFGVHQDLLIYEKGINTPVIIEIVNNQVSMHKFFLKCPVCGTYLPRHKPLTKKQLKEKCFPTVASVFYFDRVSPAIIELAKINRKKDALIVFEPSGMKNRESFKEALKACHILKYSFERLGHLEDIPEEFFPLLQIETLGADGLLFRWRESSGRISPWHKIEAYQISNFQDAAGAGDWCTSGVITRLGLKGLAGFLEAGIEEIRNALRYGQALAALNCMFIGARGSMYALNKNEFNEAVELIQTGQEDKLAKQKKNILQNRDYETFKNACRLCGKAL